MEPRSLPLAVLIRRSQLFIARFLGARAFALTLFAFVLQSLAFRCGGGFGRLAAFARALHFFELFRHPLESRVAIGRLRTAFGGGDDDSGWTVGQSHAGFDFVAVLAAGAARDEEFQVAVSFERFAVGWVLGHKLNPRLILRR